MKVGFSFQFLAALALSIPPAAAADLSDQPGAPGVSARRPTGRWVVNFDDTQCVATRDYGTAQEPLVLALKAPAAGDVMQLAVLRRGRGGRYPTQLRATIAIDGGAPLATSVIAMTTGQGNQRVYRTVLPLAQFRAVRGAGGLAIRAGNEFSETFEISAMGELLRVMGDCVADLRRVWNASEGETMSPALRERARGTLQGVFRADDYPGIAAQAGLSGSVGFVVLIDEAGRVADCTVTESSGVAALDAQSCAIISQRVRYQPAVGQDGRPARDLFHQRVTWMIPSR